MLTSEELTRYSRQLLIPEIGREGQERLKNARVLLAGVGGLGCSSSQFLTCAGVGSITVVDRDTVALSDLNRQVLYGRDDIGKRKVDVAAERLSRLNSNVKIYPRFAEITEENASKLLTGIELVVDGLDNLQARFALNSACVEKGIPFIYGGIMGLKGMVAAIVPGKTPCLACIYPRIRTHERPFPVLGSVPAIIANLQVLEAIKILTGRYAPSAGRMILFDGGEMNFFRLEIKKNETCKVCGKEMR
ncbi:MAG: HesA/MoeB/ThiF family protein [Desulfobacterales bacterium]|nr:HesA/MoeB/ThiF family protein [Desulfobacterales bacterium]